MLFLLIGPFLMAFNLVVDFVWFYILAYNYKLDKTANAKAFQSDPSNSNLPKD